MKRKISIPISFKVNFAKRLFSFCFFILKDKHFTECEDPIFSYQTLKLTNSTNSEKKPKLNKYRALFNSPSNLFCKNIKNNLIAF